MQVGNAAIEGACIALLSKTKRRELEAAGAAASSTAASKRIRSFFDFFVEGCQFKPVESQRTVTREAESESEAKLIELVDTLPDVNVQPAEYKRLLGYPRDRVLERPRARAGRRGRAPGTRSTAGRGSTRGRPTISTIDDGSIGIDGVPFASTRLRQTLAAGRGATASILVAVSAGPEVEAEAQRLWREEKPDEYFFLEIFGSAVVEHLVDDDRRAAVRVGRRPTAMAVLPHYSPGYPEWDIAEQPRLLELIRRTRSQPLPGALEVLDSGMLRPKKSLLAVFGLTRARRSRAAADRSGAVRELLVRPLPVPPRAVRPRAAPIAQRRASTPTATQPPRTASRLTPTRSTRQRQGAAALGRRAADARRAATTAPSTRCSATKARPAATWAARCAFDYQVKLGPRDEGYPIREQRCDPRPATTGYTLMCRYMNNAEHLMVAIDQRKAAARPAAQRRARRGSGRPIGAGCYCEPASRKHKWGLVLETIHLRAGAARAGATLDRSIDADEQSTPRDRTMRERRRCWKRSKNGRCSATAPWARSS